MESNSTPPDGNSAVGETEVQAAQVETEAEAAEDTLAQICIYITQLWNDFLTGVSDWSGTLQITLYVSLVILIVASCLYKRRKLAKSAMNTFHSHYSESQGLRQCLATPTLSLRRQHR